MSLKKLSSLLLSVLVLFYSLPVRADDYDKVSQWNSVSSEGDKEHSDSCGVKLASGYDEILYKIYENKDNCGELNFIFFTLVRERSEITGLILEEKFKKLKMTDEDRERDRYVRLIMHICDVYLKATKFSSGSMFISSEREQTFSNIKKSLDDLMTCLFNSSSLDPKFIAHARDMASELEEKLKCFGSGK